MVLTLNHLPSCLQVLRFDDIDQRQEFIDRLQNVLLSAGIRLEDPSVVKEHHIKRHAVTRAHRAKLLEKFFRLTFSHVSHLLTF